MTGSTPAEGSNIDSLPIHSKLRALLAKRHIQALYPPQVEALKLALTGHNAVISIPTASGKTLVAELVALQHLLKNQEKHPSERSKWGKVLYLCPLKALAAEKYHEFHDDWASLGFSVGMSRSDLDAPDFRVFGHNLVILTNEKADSLIRFSPKIIRDIEVVIADEVHLINDLHRGITLECLLTRLMASAPNVQLIGLSATVRNGRQLASWLQADLVLSSWRPVALKEGYYLQEAIQFTDGSARRVVKIPGHNEVTALTIDMLKEGGQVLIFANSRKSAMAQAEELAPKLRLIASDTEKQLFTWVQHEFESKLADESTASKRLTRALKGGVAFHHAGMAQSQLQFIVENYNSHRIKVICCTPTLAAGVNTPARRVIIKSLYRYEANKGSVLIPIMEYKQMAGRAGRPGYDPYGEVVILGSNPQKLAEIAPVYISGEIEDISSKLDEPQQLQTQALSQIVSNFVHSDQEIKDFLAHTFYFFQNFRDPATRDASPRRHSGDPSPNSALFGRDSLLSSRSKAARKIRRPKPPRKGGKGRDPLGISSGEGSTFPKFSSAYSLTFTPADQLDMEDIVGADKISPTQDEKAIDQGSPPSIDTQSAQNPGTPMNSFPIPSGTPQTTAIPYQTQPPMVSPPPTFELMVASALDYFRDNGLIETISISPQKGTPSEINVSTSRTGSLFAPTTFGKVTAQSYLTPQDAVLLREDLTYAKILQENREIDLHPLSWLHLLTRLSAFPKYYLRKVDYAPIQSFIDKYSDHFIMEEIWEPGDPEFMSFAQEVKSAMILWDWVCEVPNSDITERYSIGMGDVRRLADTAQWLIRGLRRIEQLDSENGEHSPIQQDLTDLELRLRHGVKASLLPLIKFKGIGRVRARKLYQAGFHSPDDLAQATAQEIAKVPLVGPALAAEILSQIRGQSQGKRVGPPKRHRLRKKAKSKQLGSKNGRADSLDIISYKQDSPESGTEGLFSFIEERQTEKEKKAKKKNRSLDDFL